MVGEMREQFNSEIDKAENEVEDLNLVNDTANMSVEESFTDLKAWLTMVGEMREQFNSEIDKAENEVEDLNLVNDTANMSVEVENELETESMSGDGQ